MFSPAVAWILIAAPNPPSNAEDEPALAEQYYGDDEDSDKKPAEAKGKPKPDAPAEQPESPPSTDSSVDSEPSEVSNRPTSSAAPAASQSEASDSDEQTKPAKTGKWTDKWNNIPFKRHGVGLRGGISVIPAWVFASFLDTHTNALCRRKIGNFAEQRGVLRNEGCNFFIAAEYLYRYSRIWDMGGAIGYQRFKLPDGLWLDKDVYDGTSESLSGADYTEIEFNALTLEADFVARAPIVVTKDVEFGLGGGVGVGLMVAVGGVYQTPIGAMPQGYVPGQSSTAGNNTCTELRDLANLQRCTPRWDATEDADRIPPDQADLSTPNPQLFATCSTTECSERDLRQFGYRRKQTRVPPVFPVVNLILSARVIVKDVYAITVSGGFNMGFYFGMAMNYMFDAPTK